MPQFYTYILTNWNKTVCYTGMTNNLPERLIEHWIGNERSFTTRYSAYYLVWYEADKYVLNAIAKEKEIKGWPRARKNQLIETFNHEWRFLNEEIVGHWPPTELEIEEVKEYLKRQRVDNPM